MCVYGCHAILWLNRRPFWALVSVDSGALTRSHLNTVAFESRPHIFFAGIFSSIVLLDRPFGCRYLNSNIAETNRIPTVFFLLFFSKSYQSISCWSDELWSISICAIYTTDDRCNVLIITVLNINHIEWISAVVTDIPYLLNITTRFPRISRSRNLFRTNQREKRWKESKTTHWFRKFVEYSKYWHARKIIFLLNLKWFFKSFRKIQTHVQQEILFLHRRMKIDDNEAPKPF